MHHNLAGSAQLDEFGFLVACHLGWTVPQTVFEEHDADEPDDLQNSLAVVFAAHDAAFEAKRERRSWKDVERGLRRIRKLAGRLDAKWLED